MKIERNNKQFALSWVNKFNSTKTKLKHKIYQEVEEISCLINIINFIRQCLVIDISLYDVYFFIKIIMRLDHSYGATTFMAKKASIRTMRTPRVTSNF